MTSRFVLAVLLCGSGVLNGANTPSTALLVLAKTDHALLIVDPATSKVVGQVPSGPDPHEVIASTDGKFAYISNYGGGAYNTITVVDLVQQKALPPIDLGALRGPHGLVFVGGKLWFTAEAAKVIGSYDPSTNKIDWVLGTGQNRTHMLFVFDDLKRIVTSNVSSATMTIIEKSAGNGRGFGPPPGPGGPPNDPGRPPQGGPPRGSPQGDWNETVVAVGNGAEGFDVSPDTKEIWAANAQDGTISIVDVATKKVIQTLDANVRSANRLKFTPDGKLVFVSCLGAPEVAIFDAATRKEVKRVRIGRGAAGILMQPDGSRAYVACTPDDYVAVIDLKSLAITGRLQAGKQPDGLAWAVRR
jgi:DNA-binding beta-propeller fold protein YncE